MFRVFKSTFFILFLFISFSLSASAEGLPGVTEPVTFQISPQYPRPNSSVTVSARSYNTDLNRADFVWYVNGKVFKKGTGVTEVSIPSGASGSATTVSVDVTTTDIGVVTKEYSFKPAEVSLLWQSDGYVPPFYKGKSLELYGSNFTVTAIPEFFTSSGKRIEPKNIVYSWRKNGVVDGSQSGYGKDSFTGTQSSYVRGGDTVTVEASTVDGTLGATKSITISPKSADIVFYENSPLYGILYEKALSDSFTMPSEELTLHGEPYFISTKQLPGNFSLDWSINNNAITSFKDQNEITLRTTGESGGQSLIRLDIQSANKILQGGAANITIFQ